MNGAPHIGRLSVSLRKNLTAGNLAQLLTIILVVSWSFIVTWIIGPLLGILAILSDKIKEQLEARPKDKGFPILLAQKRRAYDDCILFYCSSAGEYEQAKPLIDRIAASGSVLCHVIFFSVSGAKFVKARRDEVSWSMSPLDDVWEWGNIFSALRPSKTVIVRHELWPAFLWQAAMWSEVTVVNSVVPALYGRRSKWVDGINLAIKGWLLIFVDKLCVVDASAKDFFMKKLKIPASKISITGDTKYDRVVERALEKKSTVAELRSMFRKQWDPSGCDVLLIGGSVHLPDVELLMAAIKPGPVPDKLQRIKFLLVPHLVTTSNIARIFGEVRSHNISCELLSEVESAGFQFSEPAPRIIIADELGRLSDLYGVADLAWVGGAVHAKVHNVLEPAAWGIPVMCGVRFENSQEAVALNRVGALFNTGDPLALHTYLVENLDHLAKRGHDTMVFVQSMAGATERVLTALACTPSGGSKR
jgi:3-deoxy-D-manno-octulosonic-acid transferase